MKKLCTLSNLLFIYALSSTAVLADHQPLTEFTTHPTRFKKHHIREHGIDMPIHKKIERPAHKAKHQAADFVLQDVEIEDSEFTAPELLGTYSSYLGKKVGDNELTSILKNITKLYQQHDYLLPRPYFTTIEPKHGIIKIAIKKDSIRDVIFMGEGIDNKLLKEYADKILAETPARTKTIQRYLGLMNKLPGYNVHYTLKFDDPMVMDPTDNPVDIVVVTTKKQGKAYLNADNYGIKDIGRYQFSGLVQFFSPFKHNETIFVHGGITDHTRRMKSAAIGYSQPINSLGTSVNLLASYEKDNPTLAYPISSQDNNMKSVMANLTHHFIVRPKLNLDGQIGVNYNNATSYGINNNNKSQKASHSDVTTGFIGTDFRAHDNLNGNNLVTLAYYRGLGGKAQNYLTPSDTFNKNYNLVKFNYYRDQALPKNFSVFAHLSAHLSGKKLPNYEQFVVGGRDFARGYKFATMTASKALGFSIEGRYTYGLNNAILKEIQPYVFYDIAKIYNKPANTSVSQLSSAGPGTRLRFKHDFDIGFEVAFPMKRSFTVDGINKRGSTNFSFYCLKSFEF